MKLTDIAQVIRSKNAGPTTLTLDLLFSDERAYARALHAAALTPAAIEALYRLDPGRVTVIPYRPALAIKIVMDRPIVAGTPGDRDVYGAQQHGPLLEVDL